MLNDMIRKEGTLVGWEFKAKTAGTFYFQVWDFILYALYITGYNRISIMKLINSISSVVREMIITFEVK